MSRGRGGIKGDKHTQFMGASLVSPGIYTFEGYTIQKENGFWQAKKGDLPILIAGKLNKVLIKVQKERVALQWQI